VSAAVSLSLTSPRHGTRPVSSISLILVVSPPLRRRPTTIPHRTHHDRAIAPTGPLRLCGLRPRAPFESTPPLLVRSRPVCRLPRPPLAASTGAPRISAGQPRPDKLAPTGELHLTSLTPSPTRRSSRLPPCSTPSSVGLVDRPCQRPLRVGLQKDGSHHPVECLQKCLDPLSVAARRPPLSPPVGHHRRSPVLLHPRPPLPAPVGRPPSL
jgi:hypothetical protein